MTVPQWDEVELTNDDLDEVNPMEQMGTKEKNWVRLADDERRWLVKVARVDDIDATPSGEDWAEWLVPHLATLIGVPCATVRPATFNGARASVSRQVMPDGDELVHGNSLLSAADPAFTSVRGGENRDYTPARVRVALKTTRAPIEMEPFDAYDVWCGYLVMDAWLAGQDRHDENWAAIRSADTLRLSPSFDHGNALGFLLRDDERERRLREPDGVERWAARGRSRHFSGRPTLVALAHEALGLASCEAREHWKTRLQAVTTSEVSSAAQHVPDERMSPVARRFVTRLLEINRRRLLDDYPRC